MTTHYQKIQALGNRMASNLETMGVSASFNDGGLTLADKILQIQHFTDGLLLFADKKIEQVGTTQSPNTITLSALLIENGKAKSGETVMFYGNWNVRQEKISTQSYTVYTVDGDGEFSFTGIEIRVNQGVDYSVGLGSASTFKITISNSTFSFAINGSSDTIYGFTYDSTKPLEIWIPIEATNISNKFGYSDTTDSSGIATCEYTCTGAGLKTITAESGTFISETYGIFDCSSFDSGVYGSAVNQYWLSSTTYLTRTVETDMSGTTFSNSSASSSVYAFLLPPNTTATSIATSCVYPVEDYCIEIDIEDYTGDITLEVRGDNGNIITRKLSQLSENTSFHIKLEIKNGVGKYYIDGSSIATYTSNTTNLNNNFGVRLGIAYSSSVKIKNFKVYFI